MLQKTAEKHCHAYAVIMAGGSGTRLWPLSRKERPKQFQAFISSKTMIQETFSRVATIVPTENIFVSTTEEYKKLVLEQLPAMTEKRLILEPKSRNTAPAIALVAATIARYDKDAMIATIASDHAIENPEEFAATIDAAFATVARHRDKLVTIGINPTRPDTGLGYIRMGREFATIGGKRIFVVDAFKEKPDRKTAEEYLSSWEYLWNAGYFIFSAGSFAEWTREHFTELHRAIGKIMELRRSSSSDDEKMAEAIYSEIPSEPIDTAIVEKLSADQRLVIPSPLRWSDVGNWETLYDFLREKSDSPMLVRDGHIDIGSKNTFVHGSDRLIATIGLQDIVVIDTEDALLVVHRSQAGGEIKKLLEKLKTEGKESYL